MQKKEIENIPPLSVEKAEAKYKAIAVSKRVKIQKAEYLIIDIFKNKKESLSRYTVRIVLNNKEYANHFPDGRWTEQKIRTKDHYYIWESKGENIAKDKIFISPKNTTVIKNTIHSLNKNSHICDDWYVNVSSYQDRISEERQRIAEISKDKACNERNSLVKPAPDEFIEWAKKLHGAGYIYYQRKGKKAEFTCSKCGKTYERKCIRGEGYEETLETVVEVPRKGEKAVCSLCGAEGTYQHKGRYMKGIYATIKTAYLIQPHNCDAAVIRQYVIERQLSVNKPERYIITEYGRYFIGSHIQQRDWNEGSYNGIAADRRREWTYKNYCGYNGYKDKKGYL